MKRAFLLFVFILLGVAVTLAQDGAYRVVFDMTSRDSLDQLAVMRWVTEILKANPTAQLEVVMYGKGFELVMPEKSHVIAQVKEAAKNPNVSFRVCSIALKNNKIERNMILDDVQTVPDGIYEIVSKQREGWGYIKVAH